MKFCAQCGNEIMDAAVVCPRCGCSVGGTNTTVAANDAPNIGYAILGFFFPLIGLILYLVNKDTYPLQAKSAGKGALIGVITSVALSVLWSIIYVVGILSMSMMYW